MNINSFKRPLRSNDSGAASLWMICRCYDKDWDPDVSGKKAGPEGVMNSLYAIGRSAENIGFRSTCAWLTYRQLASTVKSPCILEWNRRFVVLLPGVGRGVGRRVKIVQPSKGIVSCSRTEFIRQWAGSGPDGDGGLVLLLEPSFKFYSSHKPHTSRLNWRILLDAFKSSRWKVMQVILALLIGSLVQFIFPFLMQGVIDVGVNARDLQYVKILLIGQLMLLCSRLTADMIRGRLLLYISTNVNLSILSDFWIKIMRLPLAYFDKKHSGEVLQRINDNRQIQQFVTGTALSTMLSALNFVVFSIVLMTYGIQLFLVFAIGIVLYILWIRFFLKFRRSINTQLFHASAKENNLTLQLVQGMAEIRLQNLEQSKRWEWESQQVKIFNLNFKNLTYTQLQQVGSVLINQVRDITLTFIVAKLLIEGQLTFGAMLAIQYIIGQLGAPIDQFIGFVQAAQDAKMSMERLNEIHSLEEEDKSGREYIWRLPAAKSIAINGVSFAYPGDVKKYALQDIHLEIPEGKVTALVGESGCGKTTLLRLLLKYHESYDGAIAVGGTEFQDFSPSFWRRNCGAVLQDSYIFQDTILRNIAGSEKQVSEEKLLGACRMANILTFIESLPNAFNTLLEVNGAGISQGQKQRLLIARAIYRDPEYVFFDESTNSLDEINEKIIINNMQCFFENRTVVVVAHRLQTIRNAHNIVVMHQGRIVEQGTHEELAARGGKYARLVRTQMEMGVNQAELEAEKKK